MRGTSSPAMRPARTIASLTACVAATGTVSTA
jgi:hypothetical protein